MVSIEISAEKVNVDVERGTVILTGLDVSEIISEVGKEEILSDMDYEDIVQYVARIEQEKKDDQYDMSTMHAV